MLSLIERVNVFLPRNQAPIYMLNTTKNVSPAYQNLNGEKADDKVSRSMAQHIAADKSRIIFNSLDLHC